MKYRISYQHLANAKTALVDIIGVDFKFYKIDTISKSVILDIDLSLNQNQLELLELYGEVYDTE